MLITLEDRLNYLKLKDSEEFTVEDMGYVFCYGNLEEYAMGLVHYMVSHLEREVVLNKTGHGFKKSEMVRCCIKVLGKEGYTKRLMGVFPDLVRLGAEDVAISVKGDYGSDADILQQGRYYVNKLEDMVNGSIPRFIRQEYLEDVKETFRDTFKNRLPDELEGVGRYYASMMAET